MKTRNLFLKIIIISTVLIAFTFSGCEKDAAETNMRTYSFTVTRSSSVLTNSSVSIPIKDHYYSATTDNNGKCKINIPNSVSLPLYTIVTIDHSSIKPYCLTVSGESNSNSSLSINCTNVPTIVRLREVALHHLGNDLYGGPENSQLQLPTEGFQKSFSYSLPATPDIMPRIQIYAKGIQYPVNIFCNGILTAILNNSASNGDLSLYDFQLSGNASTIFHAANNIITIKTGATGGSSDSWDDIEFCGLLLYYN